MVEEASGVEDFVFDAIDSLGYQRLVCIGNPIRAEGKFVDLIRQADRDRADGVPPSLAVNAIQIPSTASPHARQAKSEYGLADRTWLEAMYRKYGKNSLWVASHIEARIPDVDAEQLIPLAWLNYHSTQPRPQVPPTHPVNLTRRIACDLSEGVGRDSTCIMVVDDWGVLEVVLGNGMGLPEAAAAIFRLAGKWNVAHDKITYDKLGIGRNFPNHLARWGITQRDSLRRRGPAASSRLLREPAQRSRLEAAQSSGRQPHALRTLVLRPPTAAGPAAPVPLLPRPLLLPPGRRASPLDVQPGGTKEQAHAQRPLGHDPRPLAGCRRRAHAEHDLRLMPS